MSSNSLSGRAIDAQGTFRYSNLPPGSYRLVARARQGGAATPTTPAPVNQVAGAARGRGRRAAGGDGRAGGHRRLPVRSRRRRVAWRRRVGRKPHAATRRHNFRPHRLYGIERDAEAGRPHEGASLSLDRERHGYGERQRSHHGQQPRVESACGHESRRHVRDSRRRPGAICVQHRDARPATPGTGNYAPRWRPTAICWTTPSI
jgi:hypothetical protein